MSAPGEGSSDRQPAAEAGGQPQGTSASPLILIVEDEPAIASMEEALLQCEGFRTLRAETGAEAEELARKQHPDLMILDLYLPDKEGVEVLRTLRGDPDTSGMPVLVVSADSQSVPWDELIEHVEFIRKPFDVDTLVDAIRRALKANPPAGSGFPRDLA